MTTKIPSPADVRAERVDSLRQDIDAMAADLVGKLRSTDAFRAEATAARREGAEAMREACVARAKDHAEALRSEATEAARRGRSDASRAFGVAASAAGSIADALRVLPLPEGEP